MSLENIISVIHSHVNGSWRSRFTLVIWGFSFADHDRIVYCVLHEPYVSIRSEVTNWNLFLASCNSDSAPYTEQHCGTWFGLPNKRFLTCMTKYTRYNKQQTTQGSSMATKVCQDAASLAGYCSVHFVVGCGLVKSKVFLLSLDFPL